MKRIMIDAEKCQGCKNCALACMQAHREDNGTIYNLNLTNIVNEPRNTILKNGKNEYKPLFCRHCDEPECASSCISGALQKDDVTGLVTCDITKCASCFTCVMSCPFGVLSPDTATKKYALKCDFCSHLETGPSCVRVCRSEAIYLEEVQQ